MIHNLRGSELKKKIVFPLLQVESLPRTSVIPAFISRRWLRSPGLLYDAPSIKKERGREREHYGRVKSVYPSRGA